MPRIRNEPVTHVVVMTGAGISADSGVATFRDAGGLWEGHRPEDVATPQAWQRDRAMVWRFYQKRRAQLRTVEPNAAHHALADFESRLRATGCALRVVRQNGDDLHDRAGSQPLHMHGELVQLRCEKCDDRIRDLEQTDADTYLPCKACGNDALRPDIVWFGETPLHMPQIEQAIATCTHFLAIGTSGTVWPAAGMLQAARQRGAVTFVQSLDPPHNLDPTDRFEQGRAADVVPRMLVALAGELGL